VGVVYTDLTATLKECHKSINENINLFFLTSPRFVMQMKHLIIVVVWDHSNNTWHLGGGGGSTKCPINFLALRTLILSLLQWFIMFEIARVGFKWHIIFTSFQSLMPASLNKSYLIIYVKMSHRGGGQKNVKKVSRIIWMAPYCDFLHMEEVCWCL